MIKHDPYLQLRINEKTGDFVVMSFAVWPRFNSVRAWGVDVPVARGQMKADGLRIVMENLAGFPDRNGEDGHERDGDYARLMKFEKLHKRISVTLVEGRTLEIIPLIRTRRGGATSEYEDVIYLPYPCTNDEFYSAIELAESRAQ